MKIKGVVFDVGQTLSNQLDKERLVERNKKYYAYVFEELLKRNFSQYFPHLDSYNSIQFVEDLNALNLQTRAEKNISIEVFKEYRMSEQTIDVLILFEKSFELDISKSSLAEALLELDKIYSGTEALDEGVYELWPDTKETLIELRRRGYILGLASNTAHPVKHEHMLARLGITPLIDHFAVSSYIGVRKPNPEMLRILSEKMGLNKDEIIVVGDLLDRDVLMGNSFGSRTIWINAIPYSLEQNLKRITEGGQQYLPNEGIVCLSQLIPTMEYMENTTPSPQQINVGYYFPHIRKKLETGKKGAFVNGENIRYMPIELRAPIENLGNFDVIIHKITDLMLSDKPEDKEGIINLENYIRNHPKTLLLDPIQGLEYTNNRKALLTIWKTINTNGINVRCPEILNIDSERYPCIVKTEVACQVKGSHDMIIATSRQLLEEAISHFSLPFIIQEWISHSAVFKVYILGDRFQISSQNALKIDKEIIYFNSAKMPEGERRDDEIKLNEEVVMEINKKIKEITGLGMISYDLVVDDSTGDYVLVDLNYFPGYYTLTDYKNAMDNYIIQRFQEFRALSE